MEADEKDLLPTGIIQCLSRLLDTGHWKAALMVAASIMIRVLIASGQLMAEVPTNEQGYPASTVSFQSSWKLLDLRAARRIRLDLGRETEMCLDMHRCFISNCESLTTELSSIFTDGQGWGKLDLNHETSKSILISSMVRCL